MIYSVMTREEFIKVLEKRAWDPYNKDTLDIYWKKKDYIYEIEGNKIIVTYKGNVGLGSLTSLPSGVEFKNGGYVNLRKLTSIPPGVVFKNYGSVYLEDLTSLPPGVVFENGGDVNLGSLIGDYFNRWSGNIEGIDSKRLLNFMISKGIFER
jgi:hypothetical protein